MSFITIQERKLLFGTEIFECLRFDDLPVSLAGNEHCLNTFLAGLHGVVKHYGAGTFQSHFSPILNEAYSLTCYLSPADPHKLRILP